MLKKIFRAAAEWVSNIEQAGSISDKFIATVIPLLAYPIDGK